MAKDPREEQVQRNLEARNKSVEDFYARQEGLQPTPTQEECDRAKLGIVDQELEDDGSEWEDEAHIRVMTERLPGNSPYDTRDMSADNPQRQRKRGRPRKGE